MHTTAEYTTAPEQLLLLLTQRLHRGSVKAGRRKNQGLFIGK